LIVTAWTAAAHQEIPDEKRALFAAGGKGHDTKRYQQLQTFSNKVF
jgi:hypothetical protein